MRRLSISLEWRWTSAYRLNLVSSACVPPSNPASAKRIATGAPHGAVGGQRWCHDGYEHLILCDLRTSPSSSGNATTRQRSANGNVHRPSWRSTVLWLNDHPLTRLPRHKEGGEGRERPVAAAVSGLYFGVRVSTSQPRAAVERPCIIVISAAQIDLDASPQVPGGAEGTRRWA